MNSPSSQLVSSFVAHKQPQTQYTMFSGWTYQILKTEN